MRLGEFDTSTDEDCDHDDPEDVVCSPPLQDVKFEKVAVHPEYSGQTFINDIALVKLADEAKTKQRNIRPICMPLDRSLQDLPSKFIIVGWGRTESSTSSKILQKATVPLFAHDECFMKFNGSNKVRKSFTLTNKQFCAGGEGLWNFSKSGLQNSESFFIARQSGFMQRRLWLINTRSCTGQR